MKNNFNIHNGLKGKNLLIISHNYNDFIKDQTEIISLNFKHIDILVRHNPITEISNLLPIEYLKPYRKKSLLSLTNKPENISVIPTPVVYLPSDSGYKKLGEKHFKATEKAIDKNNMKFDFIHSQFTWSAGYVGAELKEKYNIPFVVTAHGYDIYDLPFRDDEWREKIKYVLNVADYIITVSNSNLECIKKLNVKTPVKVLPNGFSSDLFYPRDSNECRKTLNLPFDKKIILSIGSLFEVKGQQYLIEAMREVVKHRKDILCIIVGGGKLKGKLEKQIKKAGLERYAMLTGGRPHDEIPIWMNACDVFALPSLSEGNPTVMFECLGCGTPFIGTKVGGEPEVINSEDYGFLVEPANPKDLAEKILIALDKEWDNDCILDYAKKFEWDKVTEEIIKVYETLLSIKRR